MKNLRESKKALMLIAILVLVIGFSCCKESEPIIEINENIADRMIKIMAEGDTIYYYETLFWNKKKFSEILKYKSDFFYNKIEEFKKTYGVDTDNFRMEFIENDNATLLSYDIHNKFNGNWYDFHWFLNPLDLDFLDSPFEKYETGLA